MNIIELKNILESLNSVGIVEAILEPSETGTLIRGSNKERTVVCFHDVEGLHFGEKVIAVQSVNALLSRVSLFDEHKATATTVDLEDCVGTIQFKEGRRKVSYHCAQPQMLAVPRRIPGDLEMTTDNTIVISPKQVEFIAQAIGSMSLTGSKENRSIAMQLQGGHLNINIHDGEDDTLSEVFEDVGNADSEKGVWEIASFQRVMRRASENTSVSSARLGLEAEDGTVFFSISEYKIAVVSVADLDILVVPVA